MWFRGVVASMGLCLDLGAILEGHPDVVLAVNGDVIHHRQPVCFPELRQRLPAPQFLQIEFDLVLSCHALGNQVGDLGVSGIGFIEPRHQTVVPLLVLDEVLQGFTQDGEHLVLLVVDGRLAFAHVGSDFTLRLALHDKLADASAVRIKAVHLFV